MLQDRSPTKVNKTFDTKNDEGKVRTESGRLSSTTYSIKESPKRSSKLSLVKSVPDTTKMQAPTSANAGATVNARSNKNEAKSVSERVTKTKKEIEHLKEQLQKLINDGINKNITTRTDLQTVINNEPVVVTSSSNLELNKAKTFNDSIIGVIGTVTRPTIHSNISIRHKQKSPPKEESPKKIRHYNQEVAREYIKKQKQQRRELLKNQKKEVTFTCDMKKQRLEELRAKSLQLVSKNIKHTRERSRSRSREALDQPALSSLNIAQEVRTESALVPNLVFNESTHVPKKPQVNSVKFAHPQLKNVTVRSRMRDLSAIPILDIPKHIQFDVDTPRDNLAVQHSAAMKIQAVFKGYRQRKLFKLACKAKQQLKEEALRLASLSKEVQTNEVKREVPMWLQAPTALPYPYNFLSTVKRKLNLAVQQIGNAGNTNDVAVQSSIISEQPLKNESVQMEKSLVSDKSMSNRKTESQPKNISQHSINVKSMSNHKNSDLKSFLSHKCLDLDIKAVEPLVLTRNSFSRNKENSKQVNGVLRTQNGFVSDSDTSKNIPEISSESSMVVTNKQTHSGKRSRSDSDNNETKLTINMDGVKKLKLRRPKKINFNIAEEGTKLSQDISEHIDETVDSNKVKPIDLKNNLNSSNSSPASRDVSAGKDSIIASNKCDYSKHKVKKQPETPSIATNISASNPELDKHKSSEVSAQSLKTRSLTSLKIDSIIPPQDTLSSFHEYMKNLGSENQANRSLSKESSLKTPTEILEINSTKSSLRGKPQEYSSNFTTASAVSSSMPSLKHPNITLRSSQRSSRSDGADVGDGKAITNITLRAGERTTVERKVKSNEIHLKFEAELHLLNEFNDSLRQVMAVEKSLLQLHNNNTDNNKATMTYQTRDTQTSFITKSSTDSKITTESGQSAPKKQKQIPTINYSRGSDVSEHMDIDVDNTILETNDTSLITTGLELSQIKDNLLTSSIEESNVDISLSFKENRYNGNTQAGLSLEMFEQLIKDEDARIENLKTILKLREKALVDRTKGELAWLEIQKKHLRDSGQLQEISAIKKKQRGLLIKLEHERHEMQRLKQMQKAASKERKSVLREQRNMIKAQLSNTSNMITKIKRNTKEDRRQSGPLKVYNIKSHSESIRSETSMSRRSSATEEIISVVSHSQSIVSHVTEEAVISEVQHQTTDMAPVSSHAQIKTEHVKRSLLMREAALQKRRKAAEELLQWHQRLVEEEGKIAELELAASAIINQVPPAADNMGSDEPTVEKHKFKGSQLNLLWHNMTGREEKKFNDQMTYSMSQISLERFCRDAKKYALGRNKNFSKKSGRHSGSDSSLSAIDVVTELNESRSNSHSESVKTALSNSSSSDKSIKSNKSSRSIQNEVFSNHLIEDAFSKLITKSSANKDSPAIDYTSDFESPFSVEKETLEENDLMKFSFADRDLSEISKMSKEPSIEDPSEHTEIIDEDSWSNIEGDVITTIDETSKTNENQLLSKAQLDEISDLSNKQSKIDEIGTNSEVTQKLSPQVEIIDDNSSAVSISRHSVSESFVKSDSENSSSKPIVNGVTESRKPSIASNIDTSKDITTEIETDAEQMKSSTNRDETQNERNSDDLADAEHNERTDAEQINSAIYRDEAENEKNSEDSEIISLSEHQDIKITDSENKDVFSPIHTANDSEISSGVESELSGSEEDTINEIEDQLFSKTNDELVSVVDEIDENQASNETNEVLGTPHENQSLSQTVDSMPYSKTNEDPLLSGKTNENEVVDTTNDIAEENRSPSQTIDSRSYSKTNENEVVDTTNDLAEENQSPSQTIDSRPYSKTDENEVVDTAKEESSSQTIDSKTNENHVADTTNDLVEDHSPSQTIDSRPYSKTNENEAVDTAKDESPIDSQSYSKTNKNHVIDTTNDLAEDQTPSQTIASRSYSKTNENHVVETTNDLADQSPNQTIEQLLSSKTTHETDKEQMIKIVNDATNNSITDQIKDENVISTIEDNDDTEAITDDEWNKVSNANDDQDEIEIKLDEDTIKENEEETFTDTSRKSESPLLLSYGFIQNSEAHDKNEEDDTTNHENSNILDSISNKNSINSEKTEQYIINKESQPSEEHDVIDDVVLEEETSLKKKTSIDVKKRVSEILADANIPSPRGDKSPRLQDLYVTAYDVVSPEHSSDSGSPTDEIGQSFTPPRLMYGSDEVEELLKKQLEIEQEIKEIQQQQQEHIPYLYVREIPNKPPPPYTPPVSIQAPVSGSVLPATEKEIGIITTATANILHTAYVNKNLQNVSLSEEDKKRMQDRNDIESGCFEFIFDLCKEAAADHYRQYETETGPSWMHLTKRSKLALGKPLDSSGLAKLLNTKMKQWLGYETVKSTENMKHKWSGKKRDHVDELLVVECQAEEGNWTHYDRDELVVKDELTKEIMNMLLNETAEVFNNILNKKSLLC